MFQGLISVGGLEGWSGGLQGWRVEGLGIIFRGPALVCFLGCPEPTVNLNLLRRGVHNELLPVALPWICACLDESEA